MSAISNEQRAHSAWDHLTTAELAGLSGLAERDLNELVEYGAIVPSDSSESCRRFDAHYVQTLRKAAQLRADWLLDVDGLALAVIFIGQINALEEELSLLRKGIVSTVKV